ESAPNSGRSDRAAHPLARRAPPRTDSPAPGIIKPPPSTTTTPTARKLLTPPHATTPERPAGTWPEPRTPEDGELPRPTRPRGASRSDGGSDVGHVPAGTNMLATCAESVRVCRPRHREYPAAA